MFYTLFGPFTIDIMMESGSVVGSGVCGVPILGEGGSGASFLREPKPRYFLEGFPNKEASKTIWHRFRAEIGGMGVPNSANFFGQNISSKLGGTQEKNRQIVASFH